MNIMKVIRTFNESPKLILPPQNRDTLTDRQTEQTVCQTGQSVFYKDNQIPTLSQSPSSKSLIYGALHQRARSKRWRPPPDTDKPHPTRNTPSQSHTFKQNNNRASASQSSQLSLQMEICRKVEMKIILSG